MATSSDDVKKLREKITQLEAMVEKLTSKIEKQRKDHEAEMGSAQSLIETLRTSSEQTQTLYLQATNDLEEARKQTERHKKKAKERKTQIHILRDEKAMMQQLSSPVISPATKKSPRARSATISISSLRNGTFFLDEETESLRQIVSSLNTFSPPKESSTLSQVRTSASTPIPPPKPPKPSSPKIQQHNTWTRSNSKSFLMDDSPGRSSDEMSSSSFASVTSAASTPASATSSSSSERPKPRRAQSYDEFSNAASSTQSSPSSQTSAAAAATDNKRGSFNDNEKKRDLGQKMSLPVTCGSQTVTTVVYSEWTVSEVMARLKNKFQLDALRAGLYIKENKKTAVREMQEDRKISSFKSLMNSDPSKMPTLIYKEKDKKKSATNSIKKIFIRENKPTLSDVMEAILNENVALIETILYSVSNHTLLEFNPFGQAPIHAAATTNNLKIVRLFLDHYRRLKLDVNYPDNFGWTVMHHAVVSSGGHGIKEEEMLSLLLTFPGIQVDVVNNDLNTPLHYFCQKFSSPSCQALGEALIKKAPETVNRRNKNGETPLHKAIFNTSIRVMMVKLLISNQADVNLPSSKAGETALHYAARLGRRDLIKILLLAGADMELKDTGLKMTPLELAQSLKQDEVSKMLNSVKELIQWLDELEMNHYFNGFLKEELFLDALAFMDDENLEFVLPRVGIPNSEEREKIKKNIAVLKDKLTMKHFEQRIINASKDKRLSIGTQDMEKITELRKNLDAFQGSDAWSVNPADLEFLKELGSGRSGVVFKGLYKNIKVAIKVLAAHTAEATMQEFKKEFHVTSTLRSTNVVKFYGACLEPRLLIVMEYCSRGSLYDILSNDKIDIGWDRAYRFAMEMAEGLNSLHTFDPPVYHRDMKSLNLLITKQWSVKICDFGLARFNTPLAMDTMQKLCGTYSYTAPELYSKGTYTDKCDVFSSGIILWEIVYRVVHGKYEPPYLKDNPNLQRDFQILFHVANKGLRPIIPKETPPPLVDIIKRCLSANPAERPSTAELIEDLKKARSSLPIGPEVNHRKPATNSLRLSVGGPINNNNTEKDVVEITADQ